mgnify:FL=1
MNIKQIKSINVIEKNKKPSMQSIEKTLINQKMPFLSGYALKTGIHVGHRSLRLSKTNFWHPLMSQYFLGIRHGISLLDPIHTRKCLLRAFYVIALVLKTKNNHNFPLLNQGVSPVINEGFNLSKDGGKKTLFNNGGSLDAKHQGLLKNKNFTQQKQIKSKGHILIVNTNPEFSRLCKNLNVLTGHNIKNNLGLDIKSSCISYVHYKWVGGTLTNWKQVSKSILTYAKFAERCEKFLYRNHIDFPRYSKIKECFHGLVRKKNNKVFLAFNKKPDIVFLMNPNENRHIIAEANKMHVPVIALVESNTNLNGISYPIPANAYSAFFIYYCIKKILKLSCL